MDWTRTRKVYLWSFPIQKRNWTIKNPSKISFCLNPSSSQNVSKYLNYPHDLNHVILNSPNGQICFGCHKLLWLTNRWNLYIELLLIMSDSYHFSTSLGHFLIFFSFRFFLLAFKWVYRFFSWDSSFNFHRLFTMECQDYLMPYPIRYYNLMLQ